MCCSGYHSEVEGRRLIEIGADDIALLASLMRELRDLTQSRRTFAATTAFLRRFGGEHTSPLLVPAEDISVSQIEGQNPWS